MVSLGHELARLIYQHEPAVVAEPELIHVPMVHRDPTAGFDGVDEQTGEGYGHVRKPLMNTDNSMEGSCEEFASGARKLTSCR